MSVGLSQFINTPPTAENIQALVSSSMVIGLTVSTTDCNLNNFQRSLSQLNTISIDGLNNSEPINIVARQAKNSYYYFEVEPFSISGELTGDSCLQTTLNPFIEAVGFENSDFNILFNNASSSRTSTYIQDVDRIRGSVTASNMQNILDDTAIKASVPDSYYTSLAHTLGRYLGSKTSIEQYGVEPAINAAVFEGSIYSTATTDTAICNQSIEERNISEYLFRDRYASGSTPISPSLITPVLFKGTTTITSDQTSYTFNTGNLNIEPGDIIQFGIIGNAAGFEQVKVISVTYPTSNSTTVTFRRHHFREYFSTIDNYPQAGFAATSTTVAITHVEGSDIFESVGSKISKVVNRKVWVKNSEQVLVTDISGSIVHLTETCTT